MDEIIRNISIWALPVALAVILHEVAHGWMAERCGDDTARWLGRLTLNPLKHIDPIGTILIPIGLLLLHSPFIFGYAKPVPIDPRKMRHPRRDMVWVALAGPLANLVLALASTLLLALAIAMPESAIWAARPLALMAQASIVINLVLLIFNLIPLPPLDGGRVAVGLLPRKSAYHLARIEPYGFLIIVALLVFGVLQSVIGPLIFTLNSLLVNLAIG